LLDLHGPTSKAIVWAHNTYVGDARYTDMRRAGEVNIGQLAREQLGRDQVFSMGFGSYEGHVIAGKQWGADLERMRVPQAVRNSWENYLHEQLRGDNALLLATELHDHPHLWQPVGHRAIGVVYRPQFEQFGNYVSVLAHPRAL
jgi:erythromycin esterase